MYAGEAIKKAKKELIEMEKRDLRSQLFESQEENDEHTVCEIELELEGGTVINSHCGIQLCQVELDNFLKHVFQKI